MNLFPPSARAAFFFVFLIFILSTPASFAGVYDGSASVYNTKLIDHKLTPQTVNELCRRAKAGETAAPGSGGVVLSALENHTVFWKCKIEKFTVLPDSFQLVVKTPEGFRFNAVAKKNVRNLDFDRTGFVVAIKGNLKFSGCKVNNINARSVILVEPSPALSLKKFTETNFPSGWMNMVNQSEKDPHYLSPLYPFLVHRIYMHNPNYSVSDIKKIAASILDYSEKCGLDPLLLTALLNIESAFDVDAVSSSGAIGLGQLMPFTARNLGVNPMDPAQNVGGAAIYLSRQLKKWKDTKDPAALALASYNAGPGAVERYNGIPPYSETQNYVFFIKFLRNEYLKQIRENRI
ncbi:MAG: lytic transglycosylase domain-containing protein [Firmicutes bacterium]|nr:lytic transglycosylase domain-containing protein [Bacillota bacterium]